MIWYRYMGCVTLECEQQSFGNSVIQIMSVSLLLTWAVLLLPFVNGKCKVDDIRVKEDFNPYHYEGKWYLVSLNRLWGIDFKPRNFSKTGRTSWGDNANKFFGRWPNDNNTRSGRKRGQRRGRNGTAQGPNVSGGPDRSRTNGQTEGWMRGRGGKPEGNSHQDENWPNKSQGSASPNEIPSEKDSDLPNGRAGGQHGNGTRPSRVSRRRPRLSKGSLAAIARKLVSSFHPNDFQMVFKVRDDSNIDMFMVVEIFGHCSFTNGQGDITDPRNSAKLAVNFPVKWFLPCQPFWIIDTDYVGYSVAYFCLRILDDGTCDPEAVTVWTFNRKLTGHSEQEMEKVRVATKEVCVDETELTTMTQTGYCPIEDEHVQTQRNLKPTIHCNNADQQVLRITLDSPYGSVPRNEALTRSFSPTVLPSRWITYVALAFVFGLL